MSSLGEEKLRQVQQFILEKSIDNEYDPDFISLCNGDSQLCADILTLRLIEFELDNNL